MMTDTMIEHDAESTGDVLTVGMGPQAQRYSPLSQINTRTVVRLVPAWVMSLGGEKQRGQEAAPLVYNGRMFVTASYSRIYAFDTQTGRKLWKYEQRLPEGIMPCCDFVNRGAGEVSDAATACESGTRRQRQAWHAACTFLLEAVSRATRCRCDFPGGQIR